MLSGRRAFVLAGCCVLTTVVMVACGTPGSKTIAADRLFLQTASGVAIVEPGAARPDFKAPTALPSHDWSTVVRADVRRGQTNLLALDPNTGDRRWARGVSGLLSLKVVAHDGRRVALAPVKQRYYLYGRPRTTLVIVGEGLPTTQTIELKGNYEPEAFSTDGQSLFVLQYRPALRPTRYQVRRLDLTTQQVEGVYTPDAHLQESMRGTARIQAMSGDGTRLYTLYTVGRGDAARAFVHVLNLEELWAHCIDLPAEFARSPENAIALTLSRDDKRLYVTNTEADSVAEVDTVALRTIRSAPLALPRARETHALLDRAGHLFVAAGTHLSMRDTENLTELRSWDLASQIRGLQFGRGGRLYVGLRNQIVTLDTNTGAQLGVTDPPGVNRISLLGRAPRALDDGLSKITCAC